MCGIIGAVAQRDIVPNLIDGLKRLEYRGYDSCGVALYNDAQLVRARSVERVANLQDAVARDALTGYTGIAHTRWATHGKPVTENAHPHFSPREDAARIALSHNGIIENHEELHAMLEQQGYVFTSQTDSEVIAHLIDHLYNGDLFDAVKEAVSRLRGSYAIAVICRDEPHRIVGARDGMPLIVGVGEGGEFPRVRRDCTVERDGPDRVSRRRRCRGCAVASLLDRRRGGAACGACGQYGGGT